MVVWLALLCVGLGVLLVLMLRAAADAPSDTRLGLAHLAWVCLALLGGTFLVLVWTVLRYVRFRTARPPRRRPTPHVDAWKLAGQRLRLEDAPDPLEEEQGDERDDEDEPGRGGRHS